MVGFWLPKNTDMNVIDTIQQTEYNVILSYSISEDILEVKRKKSVYRTYTI